MNVKSNCKMINKIRETTPKNKKKWIQSLKVMPDLETLVEA